MYQVQHSTNFSFILNQHIHGLHFIQKGPESIMLLCLWGENCIELDHIMHIKEKRTEKITIRSKTTPLKKKRTKKSQFGC